MRETPADFDSERREKWSETCSFISRLRQWIKASHQFCWCILLKSGTLCIHSARNAYFSRYHVHKGATWSPSAALQHMWSWNIHATVFGHQFGTETNWFPRFFLRRKLNTLHHVLATAASSCTASWVIHGLLLAADKPSQKQAICLNSTVHTEHDGLQWKKSVCRRLSARHAFCLMNRERMQRFCDTLTPYFRTGLSKWIVLDHHHHRESHC